MKLVEKIKKYWAIYNHGFCTIARKWEAHRFDQNLNDAIWFFGCSHVEGVSLSPEEPAPKRLSTLVNTKVINYGVSGAGPMMVEWQLDQLLKKYKPKAIVIAWPSFLRWQTHNSRIFPILWLPACLDGKTIHFHNDHFGCKSLWPDHWAEYMEITTSGELEKMNYESVKRVREKIKEIPLIEFEYTPDCSFEKFPLPCFPWVDLAPDNMHPGPNTQQIIAKWTAGQLHEI
jgi:hypothetical protein